MSTETFWDVIVPRAMSLYANTIFMILWGGFAIALVVNQAWMDMLWNWTQALPLAARIIIWMVFTPIMVGLWIWEASWSVLGRLTGLAGIIVWTFLALSSLFRAFK